MGAGLPRRRAPSYSVPVIRGAVRNSCGIPVRLHDGRHLRKRDYYSPPMKPSCFSPEMSSSDWPLVSRMRSVEKQPVNMKNAKISSLRRTVSIKPRMRAVRIRTDG